jgi:hypothetical protein
MPQQEYVQIQGAQHPVTGRDFYVYQLNFSALAAAGSASGQISIEVNSLFTLQKMTMTADIAAAAFTYSTRPLPNVTMLITDSGSSRQLMSAAVPVLNLFGAGMLPFILPNPRTFLPNATVTCAVANYDAAATYNLKFSFIGVKTFFGAPSL